MTYNYLGEIKKQLTKHLNWKWSMAISLLVLFGIFRLIFYFVFSLKEVHNPIPAFWLGMAYDLRTISIFIIVLHLISVAQKWGVIPNILIKVLLFLVISLFSTITILIFTIDFAHFAYLQQRLVGSTIYYAKDIFITFKMVWETYPILRIILFWLLGIYLLNRLIYYFYRQSFNTYDNKDTLKSKIVSVVSVLLLLLGVYGKFDNRPLQTFDASKLVDEDAIALALNPFQSFFSSLSLDDFRCDSMEVLNAMPIMVEELGLKHDVSSYNFERTYTYDSIGHDSKQPNLVVVLLESFSYYKSSMSGNPLNPTPFISRLSEESVYFNRCFTPTYGTAKGIWALITGIPDVTSASFASNLPELSDQRSLINELKEYNKYYFIGGDPSFGNMETVLHNTIPDLTLFKQDSFKSPELDVWGISDNDLFTEFRNKMTTGSKPFFAIIQTATNHRPYSISQSDRKYLSLENYTIDSLKQFGFTSLEEFHAYRYLDYAVEKFIETVKKESYFDNTVFVFVGDHGLRGNATHCLPEIYTEKGLTTHHTPLLFYAPKRLLPRISNKIVSQLDILPTLVGLAQVNHRHYTLGKNILLENENKNTSWAFMYDNEDSSYKLVSERCLYIHNNQFNIDYFWTMGKNIVLNESEKKRSKDLAKGYYELSKFMLFHNKKTK